MTRVTPKSPRIRHNGVKRVHLPEEVTLDIIDRIASSVPQVSQLYVFGSRARGDVHDGSDVDLYVVMPNEIDADQDFVTDAYVGLWRLGIPKDIVGRKQSDFEARTHHLGSLESAVVEEGVLIYG